MSIYKVRSSGKFHADRFSAAGAPRMATEERSITVRGVLADEDERFGPRRSGRRSGARRRGRGRCGWCARWSGAANPGTADAIPAEESTSWIAVSEMLAEFNLDVDCIVAGLVGLLVERETIGLDNRSDAPRREGDLSPGRTPAVRRAAIDSGRGRRTGEPGTFGRSGCASCCLRSWTMCGSSSCSSP